LISAAATKKWKVDHGLNDDSTAGIRAWQEAGRDLVDFGNGQWRFYGYLHIVWLTENDAGQMGFYDDGVHRLASYNYLTCT
jgi:hypothetical protein